MYCHPYKALHNTEMLAAYARVDDRVQTLGIALKRFAKVSKYTCVCMHELSNISFKHPAALNLSPVFTSSHILAPL